VNKNLPNIFIGACFFPTTMNHFDVVIVGGGVIGSAIAQQISRYELNVAVFEKGSDVASATSKANSGVIHSGINSAAGSLKARFCIEGNKQFNQLSKDLGFSIKWVGKYHIAKDENEEKELLKLKQVGIQNGVTDLEIIDGKEVAKKEPNVSCYKGLWVPTAGILQPFEFTIALAEHAAINKVRFFLETKVIGLKKQNDKFYIKTNKGDFSADIVVNSAGVNCRDIISMIEEPDFNIYPCRGEYLILDKKYGSLINSIIYPVPVKELGVLGVHITPTIEGNILLGPSAEFIDEEDDVQNTQKTMKNLIIEAKEIISSIPEKGVIAGFSGIRCKLASEKEGGWADFRVEESTQTSGLINLLGIESPGLTGSVAIAKEVEKLINNHKELEAKSDFISKRVKQKRFIEKTTTEQNILIKQDPRWGRFICRCENVTEAEVINALNNPLGAKTIASVKYRCRAGMGRCQGGFCTQHIVKIMEEQFNQNINNIKLKSPKSNLFMGRTREVNIYKK